MPPRSCEFETQKFGLNIFEMEPLFYQELATVEKQTEMLEQIWDLKIEWDGEWDKWKTTPFAS